MSPFECYPEGKRSRCERRNNQPDQHQGRSEFYYSDEEVAIWTQIYNELKEKFQNSVKDEVIFIKVQRKIRDAYNSKNLTPPSLSEIRQCVRIHAGESQTPKISDDKIFYQQSDEYTFTLNELEANKNFLVNPFQTGLSHSPYSIDTINSFLDIWRNQNIEYIRAFAKEARVDDFESLDVLFSQKARDVYVKLIDLYNFELKNPFKIHALLTIEAYRKFRKAVLKKEYKSAFGFLKRGWVYDKEILDQRGVLITAITRKEDIDFKSSILLNTSFPTLVTKSKGQYNKDFFRKKIALKPITKFKHIKAERKTVYFTETKTQAKNQYLDHVWDRLKKNYEKKQDLPSHSVFISNKNKVLSELDTILSDVQHKINESNFQALIHEIKDVLVDFFVLSEEIAHDIEEIIRGIKSPFNCSGCSHLTITFFDDIRGPEIFTISPDFPEKSELYDDFKEILLSLFDVQINRNDCSLSVNLKTPDKTIENKHFRIISPVNRGDSLDLMISLIFKTEYNPYLIQNLLNQLKVDIMRTPEIYKAFHKDKAKKGELKKILISSLSNFKNSLTEFKESVFLSLKTKDISHCANVIGKIYPKIIDKESSLQDLSTNLVLFLKKLPENKIEEWKDLLQESKREKKRMTYQMRITEKEKELLDDFCDFLNINKSDVVRRFLFGGIQDIIDVGAVSEYFPEIIHRKGKNEDIEEIQQFVADFEKEMIRKIKRLEYEKLKD